MLSINNNNPIRVAQKVVGQAVASQTGPALDDELQLSLEAGHRYAIRGFVAFQLLGILSGFKFGLIAPSNAFLTYGIKVYNCVLGTLVASAVLLAADLPVAGALPTVGNHLCELGGQIEMGASDGVLVFAFAQNVSDGAAIKVNRTSFLEVIDFGG